MAPPGIAIIAGNGALPRLLAEECRRTGRTYCVVQFNGIELDWVGAHPRVAGEFEKPGRLFSEIRRHGCEEVVFAGGMRRPELNPLKFDFKMVRLLPKVVSGLRSGDDTALRGAAGIFEAEGFRLVAAHEILKSLLAPMGVLTQAAPSDADKRDADRAQQITDALGRVDVGQAAVVAQGICLGLESIQGTDVLLSFVAQNSQGLRPDPAGGKGVLYKGAKPGQDRRMDLPAIGPDTIRNAARAGLSGVVVEAGSVLMLDRDGIVAAANSNRLFVWGRERLE